ncbi:MAG: N-acetylmuramoyl-L-alanine amidase [Hyphomicrobiales bacterium]
MIVVDPGHGGIDSGTVGASGSIEKSVVLEFARVLKAELEESGAYRVLMTRDDDTFVALGDRVKFAQEHHAALLISVHADSLSDDDFRGATVYTVSDKASDDQAAALAEKENRADIVAGLAFDDAEGDVADILYELTQRETRTFSVGFARNLVGELKSAIKLVNNPHRSAGLRVLRAPDVPSVLVELGFLSNVHDEKLLASDEWRKRTAAAVGEAVRGFFSRRVAQAPE